MQQQNETSSGPVIVGVDHTAEARAAVRRAAMIAAESGRVLHLVHAVGRRAVVEVVHVGSDRYAVDLVAAAEGMLSAISSELGAPSAITTAALVGRPAVVLCAEARRVDASLIVLGAGAPGRRVSFGRSIARSVARHAACAVEVVPSVDIDARPFAVRLA